jgi:alpha-1,2-glucosyltransferase
MPTLLQTWALPAVVLVIVNLSSTWYNVVCKELPEPYLLSFHRLITLNEGS